MAVSGIGALFVAMCLHVSGQFEIVRLRMKSLNNRINANVKVTTQKEAIDNNNRVNRQLKDFIAFHNEIIHLGELTSRTFAPIAFMQFLSSAILICVCCLMLFLAPAAEKLIYQAFLMGGITDVLTYTLGGTMLIDSSTKIQEAAYDFEWYNWDVRNQKLILMIMIRARSATALKIPFFKATFDTFITVRII